jgi:ankyrin repeat protein
MMTTDGLNCHGLLSTYYGKKEFASVLLTKGADVHSIDKDGRTPLANACCVQYHGWNINNTIDVIGMLLERGSHLQSSDYNGITPLIHAASRGHVNLVSFLLKKGACLESSDELGMTAVTAAAYYGQKGFVHLLLEMQTVTCETTKERHRWL